MTGQTKELINNFVVSGDLNLIPSIIIGMQQEDNVSTVLQFKNCFRHLRNLSAHEPVTIIEQLNKEIYQGNTKIVIKPQGESFEGNIVVLDIVQFSVWMFDMFLNTGEESYLLFWNKFIRLFYVKPVLNVKGKWANPSSEIKNALDMSSFKGDILGWFISWQNLMWEAKREPRVIATRDPYVVNMWKTNKKVFWKMAFPNMMSIVEKFLNGDIDYRNKENLNGFIVLFKERDGM